MEIKAELLYPYTQDEKTKFIVEQNHRNGYEIREVRREKNTEITVPDYADVTEITQVEVPYIEMEQKEVEVERPIFETNEETGEMVQVGTETTIETIEEPVEKVRMEEQEVVVRKQVGSHTEIRTEVAIDLQAWGYTEEEIEEQKREAIGNLTLTRGDVFAGLIQARMIDESALAAIVDQMPEETIEQKMVKMLSKNALSNALNFHRNHPMVDSIGTQLGISSANLDKFFETNDYHFLLEETEGNHVDPVEEPTEEVEE